MRLEDLWQSGAAPWKVWAVKRDLAVRRLQPLRAVRCAVRRRLPRPARARHRPHRLQGLVARALAAGAGRRRVRPGAAGRRRARTICGCSACRCDEALVDLRDAGAVRRRAAPLPARGGVPPRRPAAGAARLPRAGGDLRHQRRAAWSTCSRRCGRRPSVQGGRQRDHRQVLSRTANARAATARTTRSAATIRTAPRRPAPRSSRRATAAASCAGRRPRHRSRWRRRAPATSSAAATGARTAWSPTWSARRRSGTPRRDPLSAGDPAVAARAGAARRLPDARPAPARRSGAVAERLELRARRLGRAQRRRGHRRASPGTGRRCAATSTARRSRTRPALLHLDCRKARERLGWRPVWNAATTFERTGALVPAPARARRGRQPRRPRSLRRRRAPGRPAWAMERIAEAA